MNQLILTFFYSGKIRKAPGTFGSFAALIFWFLLTKLFFIKNISLLNQNIFWGIFLISIFIYGSLAIKNYSKKFGEIDHKSVVLDEVLGQILCLHFIFNIVSQNYFSDNILILKHLLFCFILFRLLDINKPLFIGWCDRNIKNSFGVMLDDFLCGLIVAIIGLFLF